jgi:hypothetical protein
MNALQEGSTGILNETDLIGVLHIQLSHVKGNFDNTNYIKEFLDSKFNTEVDTDNVEELYRDAEQEAEFDRLSNGIIELMETYVGVRFDAGSGDVNFDIVYDMYFETVVNIQHDLWLQFGEEETTDTGNTERGLQDSETKLKRHYLTDEFLANDDFFQGILEFSIGDLTIEFIVERIDLSLVFIDNDTFKEYVTRIIDLVYGETEKVDEIEEIEDVE